MPDAFYEQSKREARLRALAEKLEFNVERHSGRFTLTRTIDVEKPEREDNLTLEQAEKLLETWKLRGPHGG